MRTMICLQSVLMIVALLTGCTEQRHSSVSAAAKDTSSPPSGQSGMATPTAAGKAAPSAEAATNAQPLIDKASAAIQGGKLDQAGQLLTQLDGMKGMLPTAMQDKIASLHQALDMANAAKGLQIPGATAK
jgi:hypothetical protein